MSITGLGEVANLADSIVNKIWPDASEAQKNALTLELAKMQAQTDTNKVEAANTSVFVAGWRPAVGWSCAAAFAWTFILAPMVTYAAALAGHPLTLPSLDISQLSPVLMGMLGLSVSRTYEKVNGVKMKAGS